MFGKNKKMGEITYIASGCNITGETEFTGNALIGGSVFGKVHSEQQITIEPEGLIHGELCCHELKVAGVFKGKLKCERLVITGTGNVEGEVASKSMEIFDGGQFVGVRVKDEVNLLQKLNNKNNTNKNNTLSEIELQPQ
ncbi:bactofilin family protein [Shewanella fodinae]|uniref:Polymer-forming protein n=1 Tax=Shewanella fodinae TaxID=552357 RepID=A0A4R2FLL2_9GAMM|nr:polymer-forming cytoskeletal protein [Shewanella fodinae]TCN85361.1 polymer-forming protein [Shewanella fodinae]